MVQTMNLEYWGCKDGLPDPVAFQRTEEKLIRILLHGLLVTKMVGSAASPYGVQLVPGIWSMNLLQYRVHQSFVVLKKILQGTSGLSIV